MEKSPFLVLAGLLLGTAVLAEDAYKWIDADGVVHYSDVPVEGAERVDLSGFSRTTGARIAPSRPAATSETGTQAAADAGPFRYATLSITSPAAEETLWNIEGVLNVSLALDPPLQQGHQVRVYFDGTPRIVSASSFQIDEVWRGVHNLQAEVIDETGRLMIRSQPNRFYVQQNTVIAR